MLSDDASLRARTSREFQIDLKIFKEHLQHSADPILRKMARRSCFNGRDCKQLEAVRDRYNKRCPRPADFRAALAPGQMRGIFDRIMADFPHLEPERISEDPPVILFHKFFSESETDAFIRHGKGRYDNSLGVGLGWRGAWGAGGRRVARLQPANQAAFPAGVYK